MPCSDPAKASFIQFVKGGKEATVFRCRAGNRHYNGGDGAPLYFAAKVYRPRRYRRFRDDADYQSGRVILVSSLVIKLGQLGENRHIFRITCFGLLQQLERGLAQNGVGAGHHGVCKSQIALIDWRFEL